MTAVTRNMRKVIPPMHHVNRKLSAWRETRGGWRCNQTFWRICKVYLRPVSSYPWRNIERQISEFVIFSLSPLRSSFIFFIASSGYGHSKVRPTTPKRLFYLTGARHKCSLSFLQTFKKEPGSVHCPFSPKNFTDLSISI